MSDLFYRNRRLLLLTIGMITVAGLAAFQSLPRLEDPQIVPRGAIVTTRYPGADAARVEGLVTDKIEERLSEVEEIKTITSESRAGSSVIEIELRADVRDVDEVWARIDDELTRVAADLPSGALHPQRQELDVRSYAMIAALTWENREPVSYSILGRLAEGLKDDLQRLPGTEKVRLFGSPGEEITVEVDAARLASMKLTIGDVSRQLQLSDGKVSAGRMHGGDAGDLLIKVDGQLNSLDRIGGTPIRMGQQGQFVHLRDVASISKGIRRPAAELALVGGKPAVAVGALAEPSFRVDRWADTAHAKLAEFERQLPAGVKLEILFDQSRYTQQRLSQLLTNLALGALAVVVVALVAMGWRAALVVTVTLPLSSFMTLAGMWLLGIPIHQMSVTGLIIALGLLIDNAIVMVDEVRSKIYEGKSVRDSIVHSVRKMAIPLLGSTLTTVFAFAPIAMMPGSIGEFVGTIAVSVILSLLSSFLLTLTVVPALAGLVVSSGSSQSTPVASRTSGARSDRHWWALGFSNDRLTHAYSTALDRVLARPVLGILIALILPVAGFLAVTQLAEQFFPATKRDMFQVELELPRYASMAQTLEAAKRARQIVRAHSQLRDVHWFLGQSAPSFYYNIIGGRQNASYYAQGMVHIDSRENSMAIIRRLQKQLDAAIPAARVLVRQLEQGPPFHAPIELRLYGSDLDQLAELGADARAILSQVPDVVHTDADLSETQPKLSVQLREEEARSVGLDRTAIAHQFDHALDGVVGGSLLESTERLPVRVRMHDADRGSRARLSSFELLPAANLAEHVGGNHIPVASIGRIELVPQRAVIARRDGRRVNVVRAYLNAGVLPSQVLADFRVKLKRDLPLPAGYEFEFGGEFAKRNDAMGNLSVSLGILLAALVVTLVLSLGSFRLAGVIAVVATLAVGLGFGSLAVFGFPFGFMAIVGTMGLVGVAINDSIVVLAAIREDDLARCGDKVALRRVVVNSTRHVLATTLTTVAGFLPLILEGGGFWPPLAVTIAAGVVGATLLALVLVPSCYLLLFRSSLPVAETARVLVHSDTATDYVVQGALASQMAVAKLVPRN